MKALKRIVLGSLLFLTVVVLGACAQKTTVLGIGEVTVEIITAGDNPETQTVETEYISNSKTIRFEETDDLMGLLRANFTVYCANAEGGKDETCSYDSGFGRYLVAIDSLDATTITNGYISFYIDGAYAMSGIDMTELEDGRIYSFKLETF
jgi:hypothetical protein